MVANPNYSHVTAIAARALQTEANGPVSWSGLQGERVERTPEKNAAPSRAPKTALKLFVSVPSFLRARPSIDTVSLFFLGRE